MSAVDEMIAEVDIDGDGRIDFEGELTVLFAHLICLHIESQGESPLEMSLA